MIIRYRRANNFKFPHSKIYTKKQPLSIGKNAFSERRKSSAHYAELLVIMSIGQSEIADVPRTVIGYSYRKFGRFRVCFICTDITSAVVAVHIENDL